MNDLHRCNDSDRSWLQKVAGYTSWWPGWKASGTQSFSDAVAANIAVSEFWPTNADNASLLALDPPKIATIRMLAEYFADFWPRYPHDEYFGKWPETSVPLLILQGTLDPRTPFGAQVKTHYTGDNQYYVEVPHGAHGQAWPAVSPMTDLRETSCGWQIIRSFLQNPKRRPDSSCTSRSARLDFVAPPAAWMAMIGIDDLWENASREDAGTPEAGL